MGWLEQPGSGSELRLMRCYAGVVLMARLVEKVVVCWTCVHIYKDGAPAHCWFVDERSHVVGPLAQPGGVVVVAHMFSTACASHMVLTRRRPWEHSRPESASLAWVILISEITVFCSSSSSAHVNPIIAFNSLTCRTQQSASMAGWWRSLRHVCATARIPMN